MGTRLNIIYQIVLSVVSFDQISKYYAVKLLGDKSIVLIENIFVFDLHFNEGVAFSLPIKGVILPTCILVVMTLLLYKYGKEYLNFKESVTWVLLGLIYGGAISNIIDRVNHGAVVDFISIYSFPVFNLADSAITIAAVLMILLQKKIFI